MKSKSSAFGNTIALKVGKTADLKARDPIVRDFLRKFMKTASPQSSLILVEGKRPQLVENPKLSDFGIELEGASVVITNKRPALKGNEGREVVFISARSAFLKEVAQLKDNADVNAINPDTNAFLVTITFRPSASKPVISFIQVDKDRNGHMLTYSTRSYANFLFTAEILKEKGIIEEIPEISAEKSAQRDPRPSGVRLGNMGITSPTAKPSTPKVTIPTKGPIVLDDLEAVQAPVDPDTAPAKTKAKPTKVVKVEHNENPIVTLQEDEEVEIAPPTSKLRPKKAKPTKVSKKDAMNTLLEEIENTDSAPHALELVNEANISAKDCRVAVMAALKRPNDLESVLNNLANLGGNVERGWADMELDDIQNSITPEMLYAVEDSEGIDTLISDLDELDEQSGYERGYVFWLLLYMSYDDVNDYIAGMKGSHLEVLKLDTLNMAVGYGMLTQDQADEIEDLME